MKKIIILIFLLLPLIGNSQDENPTTYLYDNSESKNLITGWYGNQNSYMIEYSRNVGYDVKIPQSYGFDVGIGYNVKEDISKITVGGHGIVDTYSNWDIIYKMGIVLYGVESYDVFLGGGVQKNKLHLVSKINLINIVNGNYKEGEWIEFGFGFSF